MLTLNEHVPCLRVHAAELFEMPQFQVWVKENIGSGLATWHFQNHAEFGEYSDIFIVYDHGEGPESPYAENGMPKECWDLVCELCDKCRVDYAVLWLLNFPDE